MTGSLRLRLFLIIVLPLGVLACLIGVWRALGVWHTANDVFDRSLMFAALAVSRDVELLGGNAISPQTARRLADTAGGPLRYHVYGPDGALVIGYAVPPVPVERRRGSATPFEYFDARYKGAPVRVLRLKDESSIGGLAGTYTITLWQRFDARNAFAREQALRAIAVLCTLTGAVALLVWFGVRRGLRPLTDLEDAISRRSSEDLSAIRRPVPEEARGLVARLNALLGQLRDALDAQAAFVSDASHQLRNPIAGLRALGESILTAPSLEAARARAADLVAEAERAGRLAERLLVLQRAESGDVPVETARIDLAALVRVAVAKHGAAAGARGVRLSSALPPTNVAVAGDRVLLGEALGNLIDNAFVHGGPRLSRVTVSLAVDVGDAGAAGTCRLCVVDDGTRVERHVVPTILARFGQATPGAGSGLGLSIAEAAARRHGGHLDVLPVPVGFSVAVTLPLLPSRT